MRTSRIHRLAGSLALCASSLVYAQQPAAPQVTMGADIKLLRFDWEPVAGAAFYQLRFRPEAGAAYQPVGERIPASITQTEQAIPVHLQDWSGMRFTVAACNSAGCTNSAALNPRSLMLDTIGYLKASNAEREDAFGQGVALSADGYTLAVSATYESSNATGVNGNQANNLSYHSGAVYVFRRRGNAWHQEAYLKAGINEPQQGFGVGRFWDIHATALSADGTILAAAAPGQDVDGVAEAGAVYVFRRSQDTWSQVARLQAPELLADDNFGFSLDMSHDGRTLKVMAVRPRDSRGNPSFRTHIFVRPATSWQHTATLAAFHPGDECHSTRMSRDGQTLVSSCVTSATGAGRIVTLKRAGNAWVHAADLPTPFYEMRQPVALNGNATRMALLESRVPPLMGVYRWNGANWAREAGLAGPASSDPLVIGNFGYDLTFDDTGRMLAIGDPQAREANAGVSATVMPGPSDLGAVYLYRLNEPASTWALRNVVKSPRPGFRDWFGLSIALSGSGRTLAVGGPGDNSNATGIDGDRNNELAQNAGAAYLY